MSTTTTLFGSTEAQAARDLIGGTAIGDLRNDLLKQILVATANRAGGSGGAAWGAITGTLSAQTDLAAALALKVPLTQFTGGGTLATGGFTLTVPATGTAALLGTANVFTEALSMTPGTITASKPLTITQTWNNAAVAFRALLIDITGTAFGNPTSQAIEYKFNGTTQFKMDHGGVSVWGSNGTIIDTNNQKLQLASNWYFTFAGDVLLYRKAAAVMQMGLDAAGVTNQMFTAASRITSDGVGANLTIAGGNGRGGAGGSLIFSTYDTGAAATIGVLRSRMVFDTAGAISFPVTTAVTTETVVSDTTWPVTINGVAYKVCLKA